ncbi:peptidase M23 [Rhodococcus hoagii]|nr:peptidase M23 [Prescottella equi]MBP0084950.1 peptidase M23 [Prescottella equi]MBP0089869.1 peptidase M23 [Prescottella equi]MBP0094831.1 peptidase M23 [Prescottella equi]MBP0099750.1 peptidase M23 [Prescottella equi]
MLIMVTAVVVIFSDEEDCDPASGDGGSIAAAGSLVKPTKSNETTDTSGFGARWGTEHKGIDRAGPVGTPIYAFTDGRVVESGPASGFGNWIVIDHEIDGKVYSTVYGHMFDDGLMVKAGDHVRAGQQIAVIGNAGQSTGAHLHFEVWDGGRLPDGVGNAVNPQSWIDQASEPGETTAPSTPPVGEDGGGFGGFNNRQMAIAKQIVAVGEVMGVPDQGAIVALATASQESGFRMYANDGTDPRLQPDQKDVSRSLEFPHDAVGRDHGSVNQFQQQYPWWGTLEELMDSATASRKFFEALLKIPGWESMPVTVAAQSVQNSMYPDYYADDEPIARQLHAQFKGAGANLTPAELASITEGGAITVADGGSSSCGDPVPGPGTSGGSGPSSDFGRAVIEAASRWIGTPYVWGGGDQNGPTDGGFDCSGLTLYAIYQASGGRISLPHFTGSNANPGQLNDASGQEVQFSAKQPGDLIFFGPASETHHVGIYYGVKDGQEMLLHAPQSGETVTIAPLSGMSNEQMHVRRFGSSPAVKEIP